MSLTFDKHGNPQPHSILALSDSDFHGTFTGLEDKKHRGCLAGKLSDYQVFFQQEAAPATWEQWVGGSYTTQKKVPSDIDLVNWVDPDSAERLLRKLKMQAPTALAPFSKQMYSVDAYVAPVFDKTDPRRRITQDRETYWKKQFGEDRYGRPRAIVKLVHR